MNTFPTGSGSTQSLVYNVLADSWSEGVTIPRGLWGYGAARIDSHRGLVVGGSEGSGPVYTDKVRLYDHSLMTLTDIGTLEESLKNVLCGRVTVAVTSTVIICTGGETEDETKSTKTYVYHITGGNFARRPEWDLPTGQAGATGFETQGSLFYVDSSNTGWLLNPHQVTGGGSHWHPGTVARKQHPNQMVAVTRAVIRV